MAISFVVPFVFVNLEYNLVGTQKFHLKDKFSHNLAQLLQIISGEHYLITTKVTDREELQESIENIDSSLKEIEALITLIRDL
jgi:hypothetical protein